MQTASLYYYIQVYKIIVCKASSFLLTKRKVGKYYQDKTKSYYCSSILSNQKQIVDVKQIEECFASLTIYYMFQIFYLKNTTKIFPLKVKQNFLFY